MQEWKVQVERPMGQPTIRIYITRPGQYGFREFLTKGGLETRTIEKSAMLRENDLHFAELDEDSATGLIEALGRLNVAQPAKEYAAGKLEATERHLEDMRTIALRARR